MLYEVLPRNNTTLNLIIYLCALNVINFGPSPTHHCKDKQSSTHSFHCCLLCNGGKGRNLYPWPMHQAVRLGTLPVMSPLHFSVHWWNSGYSSKVISAVTSFFLFSYTCLKRVRDFYIVHSHDIHPCVFYREEVKHGTRSSIFETPHVETWTLLPQLYTVIPLDKFTSLSLSILTWKPSIIILPSLWD